MWCPLKLKLKNPLWPRRRWISRRRGLLRRPDDLRPRRRRWPRPGLIRFPLVPVLPVATSLLPLPGDPRRLRGPHLHLEDCQPHCALHHGEQVRTQKFKPSLWLQNKSSVLAWPGQGRPGQSGTFVLKSTGGFKQVELSPCIWVQVELHSKQISFYLSVWICFSREHC